MTIISFLFLISFMYLTVSTVRYFIMLAKWEGGDTGNPFDLGQPLKAPEVGKKTITRAPHPELVDVKPGDELLVVKFSDEWKEPEPSDPLLESLRDRMEELYEDDDEDDGDGDVPAKLLPRS